MALLARSPASRRRGGRLSVGQAVVLGLIQGPAEVLPVSSSGHLVLVPALMRWPYARLPADLRKTFEVALHTGAGLALAWLLRDDLIAAIRDPAGTALLAAPASAVALALEDRIEQKASSPRIAAIAMVAGGMALGATDELGSPDGGRGSDPIPRSCEFVVGLAQAAALVPGVSRNGATLTAARALGLDAETAARLSWRAGLPIIGGATLLKLVRLRQHGLAPELRMPFAVGAVAAFASTLAAAPLLRVRRQRATAAYRVAFGALALRRLHRLEWPRD
jgi:undecaprenyl-diphosphatase